MNQIDLDHCIASVEHFDTKIVVKCYCGAVWSERAKATKEDIQDTLAAHKVYFIKPKMVTL